MADRTFPGAWCRAAVLASAVAVALVSGTAASAGAAVPPAAGGDAAAESLMDLTVKASGSSYEGTVSVTVSSETGLLSSRLHVIHADARHLVIEAPDPPGPALGSLLVQSGQSRSVARVPDGGVSRGRTMQVDDLLPDGNLQQLLGKYRVVSDGTARVLGRDAGVVRIERISDGRAVERWTIEAGTGLLLERESYDAAGRVERSYAFTSVREPYVATEQDLHPASQVAPFPAAQQLWFTAPELSRQARALGVPETLPAGYRLESGTTFKAGAASVVQLVYSDGLEDVSLFAQPGSMARSGLPASARNVRLSRVDGLRWEGFPRGVAWQDGQSTLTLVGAAPTDELTQMANALPQAPLRRSLRQRMGHLVDWMQHRLP
ncbi:MAG: sigma-E factor negative regulatory protein RseB [Actinomycetota bacterium]|nr:sigma-E factor negative regulatory protein RseB [Actinomycetota bacterium]